jgi:hypothetical protein
MSAPVWRVVLKKTQAFEKGSMTGGKGRNLKKYLARYVDQIGKERTKSGEGPGKSQPGKEAKWLLPEEKTGVLWAGGFLGGTFSPGNREKNKQRGWINRQSEQWESLLQTRARRKSDGWRFVLSLGQRAVEDLTESKISPDLALQEIWRKTMELYRAKHGWDKAGGEIGWLAGFHHDTDNSHMHVIIFPTTWAGDPLRTSYRKGGKEKDLENMIGLANIAAEIYWRENLGLEYQEETYQQEIVENPESEPALPKAEDFRKGRTRVQGKRTKRKRPVIALVEEAESIVLRGGRRRKPGGRNLLEALLKGVERYGTRKVKLPELVESILGDGKKGATLAEREFPDEAEAINTLIAEGGTTKAWKKLLGEWKKKGGAWARAVMALALSPDDEPPKDVAQQAMKEAELYQKTFGKMGEGKYENVWDKGTQLGTVGAKFRQDWFAYRRVKKETVRAGKASGVWDALVKGALGVSRMLGAKKKEIRAALTKRNGKVVLKREPQEWEVKEGTLKTTQGEGIPWPEHLDPERVLLPLERGETPEPPGVKTPKEQALEVLKEEEPQTAQEESTVIRIFKGLRRRRKEREARIKEAMKEPEEPDMH